MDWNKYLYQKVAEKIINNKVKTLFKISDSKGILNSLSAHEVINNANDYISLLKSESGKICVIYHEIDVKLIGFIIAAFFCHVKILIRRTSMNSENDVRMDIEFVQSIIPVHMIYTDSKFEIVECLTEVEEYNQYDFIQLSSGTTNSAKAYCLTLEGIIQSAIHIQQVQHLSYNSKFFSYLTLSHIYGFVSGFLLPIVSDSVGIFCKTSYLKSDPSLLFKLLTREKVTHTSAIISTLIKGLELKDEVWDLSSLVCISLGGEKVDISTYNHLLKELKIFNMNENVLVNSYGMSEKGSITMEDPYYGNCIYENNGKLYVSVGDAKYYDTEIAIFDDDLKILCDGKDGMIGVKSPYLAKYYYKKRKQYILDTVTVGNNKWYLNGDCGFIHDSKAFITGRKVNTVIYNGLKISADILNERILVLLNLNHLNIRRCFCFNYPSINNYVVCLIDSRETIDKDIINNISRQILNEYHIHIVDFWITQYEGKRLEKISLPDVIEKYTRLLDKSGTAALSGG